MPTHPTGWRTNRGGAWGIGLLGAALVGTALVVGARHAVEAGVGVYPLVDAAVVFVLGSAVAAGGRRLSHSDVEEGDVWRVAIAVGLGIIGTTALTGWLLLAQLQRGVVPREPLVTLAVTQTVGAVVGLAVGVYHVRSIRSAASTPARETANASEEQLQFVTHLLRHHLFNGAQVITSHAEFLTGQVDPEAETHLETIRRRSDRMVALLENMQVLVDSYDDPALEPVDLRVVLDTERSAVERANPGATVTVDGATDVTVAADALLPVVFETLLQSAMERSSVRAPTVSVGVERAGSTVVVTVSAPGPTLDDGVESLLVDRAQLREGASGESLGFYVSERLVEGYGGTLAVDDRGSGPSYRVELPLADTTASTEGVEAAAVR